MKRLLLTLGVVVLVGCTEAQLKAASEKVQAASDAVDTAAGLGFGGPWTILASLGLNAGQLVIGALRGKKIKTQGKVIGVISRSLDAAAKGEAGEYVSKEIKAVAGVTSNLLKKYHGLARDNEI
jgi:hypothetical protein